MAINGTTGNDTINGTTGADTVYGLAGNDSVTGDDGSDYLDGGEGNDTISGGIGADTLVGGDGNDQLSKYLRGGDGSFSGGAGDDTIWGGDGNDTIDGGSGNDSWLQSYAGNDSITGADGNDAMYGDEGSDTLEGGTGDDYLNGGEGNDTLMGGDEADSLTGGAGNDLIYGGAGDDKINYVSDIGNDTVYGGDGNDYVSYLLVTGNKIFYGENGNDSFYGGLGSDSIDGGTGNDYLDGGDGNDTLIGGDGLDSLTGGAGNDLIYGGTGGDRINYVDDSGNDTLYGGDGDDYVSYVSVTGDKIFYGEGGNDSFYGGLGNDSIDGGIGNDYLDGGNGNNFLDGGADNDSIYGGMGNDSLIGGEGNNVIRSGAGIDSITSGSGNDNINGNLKDTTAPSGAYTFWTNSGSKTISTGSGDDFIYGSSDTDTIDGGDGGDVIYGAGGNDSINGGSGNDYIYHDTQGNATLMGGAGQDYISADGSTVSKYLDGGVGNDSLYGGIGNDTYIGGEGNDYLYDVGGNNYFDAGIGNDTVYGDAGNDTVNAGAGDDSIFGWSGHDSIDGGIGNDSLLGGEGNDTLIGGEGLNELYGGDGDDIYYISNTTTYIYDSGGTDTAYLSASFVKVPSTVEKVVYTSGAETLPYWIDALLPDSAAGLYFQSLLGASKNINYTFPTSLPTYNTSADDATGWKAFTTSQQNRSKEALAYISSVAGINFSQSSSSNALNTITFANNDQTVSGSGGYASYPSSTFFGSDLFLDNSSQSPSNVNLQDGTYGALTLIHEIGHAIGLKHPGNYNAGGGGANPPYLSGVEDSTTWTVMSYTEYPAQYYLQFSALDIAALQYLYGPSPTARTSDDIYQVSATNSNFIWDGAGKDIITLANTDQGATIYLTPGYWGYVGTKSSLITAAGQVTVNFGTVIEQMFGSTQSDALYGNEANNTIDGGSGNDLIEGWAGSDSLAGSLGNDTLTGGSGNDECDGGGDTDIAIFSGLSTNYTIQFSTINGTYTVIDKIGTDGTDILNNIEIARFSDKDITLANLDLIPPTIASSVSKTILIAGDTATLTFTLSEASTNFIAADVTVAGGTLSNFTGNGAIYTATFTPTASSTAQGVVSIASGVFTDAAGNANADGSDANNTVTFAVDTRVPTYALSTASNSVNEGSTATFTLTTTNVPSGTSVPYTLSGLSAADISGGLLTGSAIVNSIGTATISIGIFADNLTEGPETLIVTAQGKSASVTVNDTSKTAPTARTGTATADTINNSAVSENIDGGAGIDTVGYTSNSTAVVITRSGQNTVVTNSTSGEVDTLTNVERLKFADKAVALDTDGVGGQAYRIYQAAFNRTPDSGGLGFWISVMDGGASLKAVAGGFVDSAEFKAVYGASPTNAEIVTRLYDNVLHRPGETGGYNFWLGILDRGDGTVADVLAAFSESAENQAGVIGVISNGFAYTPVG